MPRLLQQYRRAAFRKAPRPQLGCVKLHDTIKFGLRKVHRPAAASLCGGAAAQMQYITPVLLLHGSVCDFTAVLLKLCIECKQLSHKNHPFKECPK